MDYTTYGPIVDAYCEEKWMLRDQAARIETVEALSRVKNAEPMATMAQSREIEATTSPEDSNTGGGDQQTI